MMILIVWLAEIMLMENKRGVIIVKIQNTHLIRIRQIIDVANSLTCCYLFYRRMKSLTYLRIYRAIFKIHWRSLDSL